MNAPEELSHLARVSQAQLRLDSKKQCRIQGFLPCSLTLHQGRDSRKPGWAEAPCENPFGVHRCHRSSSARRPPAPRFVLPEPIPSDSNSTIQERFQGSATAERHPGIQLLLSSPKCPLWSHPLGQPSPNTPCQHGCARRSRGEDIRIALVAIPARNPPSIQL